MKKQKNERKVGAVSVECVHHNKDNGQTTNEKYLIGFDLVKDKGLFMLIANEKTPNNLLVVPFAELFSDLLDKIADDMVETDDVKTFVGGKKK